jgi:hypothetical protein
VRFGAAVFVLVGAAALTAVAIASLPRGVSGRATVHCHSIIEVDPEPTPGGLRVLFGRVAMAREDEVLTPVRTRARVLPYWMKSGLVIRRGGRGTEPVDIVVPPGWKKRFAVGWGDGGLTAHAHVLACSGPYEWNAYAGGFRLRAPACVPLTVRVGNQSARIRVAIGARCS